MNDRFFRRYVASEFDSSGRYACGQFFETPSRRSVAHNAQIDVGREMLKCTDRKRAAFTTDQLRDEYEQVLGRSRHEGDGFVDGDRMRDEHAVTRDTSVDQILGNVFAAGHESGASGELSEPRAESKRAS